MSNSDITCPGSDAFYGDPISQQLFKNQMRWAQADEEAMKRQSTKNRKMEVQHEQPAPKRKRLDPALLTTPPRTKEEDSDDAQSVGYSPPRSHSTTPPPNASFPTPQKTNDWFFPKPSDDDGLPSLQHRNPNGVPPDFYQLLLTQTNGEAAARLLAVGYVAHKLREYFPAEMQNQKIYAQPIAGRIGGHFEVLYVPRTIAKKAVEFMDGKVLFEAGGCFAPLPGKECEAKAAMDAFLTSSPFAWLSKDERKQEPWKNCPKNTARLEIPTKQTGTPNKPPGEVPRPVHGELSPEAVHRSLGAHLDCLEFIPFSAMGSLPGSEVVDVNDGYAQIIQVANARPPSYQMQQHWYGQPSYYYNPVYLTPLSHGWYPYYPPAAFFPQ